MRDVLRPFLRLLLPVVTLAALASFTSGQDSGSEVVFTDPNVDFTFILPNSTWKMIVKPTAADPSVEYVYGDRVEGHLEIRRIQVKSTDLLSDLISQEEQKLQFALGFVAGKEENITGKLRGVVYNYEFVRAGRPMAGRFYYLRAGDTTVYVLRFTGRKDNLRRILSQTDSIARTFNLAAPKA